MAWTGPALRMVAIAALCAGITACSTTQEMASKTEEAEIESATKFSEAAFGVERSERVTTSKAVPKGGGKYMVGNPYKIAGKWYTPVEDPDYNRTGLASWYGPNFHGRFTANGEIYDQYHLSAAHPTFPLPSYARVTNQKNGASVVVRVNDRGPFAHNRIIDVSSKAAELLAFKAAGVASVNVEYLGPAPLDGRDMPFLMASYREPGQQGPTVMPEGQIASGVMLAMNETGVPGVSASDAFGSQPASLQPAVMQASPATAIPVSATTATLPDIGPVPPDRPVGAVPMASPAPVLSAYAEQRVASASEPFEAVLAGPSDLSVAGIIGAWSAAHE